MIWIKFMLVLISGNHQVGANHDFSSRNHEEMKKFTDLAVKIKMLSEKDTKIISHLRKNSRMKLTELSQAIGIPVTTLYSKLQNYEKDLIKKHTSLICFSQLGYKSVYFVLKAKEKRKELQDFLQQHQNINSLLRTNYDTDFLLEGVFQNEKEVNDFLEELQEKFEPRIQMLNVIEELRKEEFMSRKGDDETWN